MVSYLKKCKVALTFFKQFILCFHQAMFCNEYIYFFRALLHDANSHQQDLVKLKDMIDSLPEKDKKAGDKLDKMTQLHSNILKKAQGYVEIYEGIVSCHQDYTKAVMDVQEWNDATHNTVLLWGDTELERLSLHTNLDRLKVFDCQVLLHFSYY